eukprot:m.1448783 g.1448783  ORF g.1448783 m.1448783 type:complete len:831 (-) comp25113_c0_seq12:8817-11309(-)
MTGIIAELDEKHKINARSAWERARNDATFFSLFSTSEDIVDRIKQDSVLVIDDRVIARNDGPALDERKRPRFLQFLLHLAENVTSLGRLPFCQTLNSIDSNRKYQNNKSIRFSDDDVKRADEFKAIDRMATLLDEYICAPACFDDDPGNPSERIKFCLEVQQGSSWADQWEQDWKKMKTSPISEIKNRFKTLKPTDMNLLCLLEALSFEEYGKFASDHLEHDSALTMLFKTSWTPELDSAYCDELLKRLANGNNSEDHPFTDSDVARLGAMDFKTKITSLTVEDVKIWATHFQKRNDENLKDKSKRNKLDKLKNPAYWKKNYGINLQEVPDFADKLEIDDTREFVDHVMPSIKYNSLVPEDDGVFSLPKIFETYAHRRKAVRRAHEMYRQLVRKFSTRAAPLAVLDDLICADVIQAHQDGKPVQNIHLFNTVSDGAYVTVSTEVSLRWTATSEPYKAGAALGICHVGLPVSCVYLPLSVSGSLAFHEKYNAEHVKPGETASVLLSFPSYLDFCEWANLSDNIEIVRGSHNRPLPWNETIKALSDNFSTVIIHTPSGVSTTIDKSKISFRIRKDGHHRVERYRDDKKMILSTQNRTMHFEAKSKGSSTELDCWCIALVVSLPEHHVQDPTTSAILDTLYDGEDGTSQLDVSGEVLSSVIAACSVLDAINVLEVEGGVWLPEGMNVINFMKKLAYYVRHQYNDGPESVAGLLCASFPELQHHLSSPQWNMLVARVCKKNPAVQGHYLYKSWAYEDSELNPRQLSADVEKISRFLFQGSTKQAVFLIQAAHIAFVQQCVGTRSKSTIRRIMVDASNIHGVLRRLDTEYSSAYT